MIQIAWYLRLIHQFAVVVDLEKSPITYLFAALGSCKSKIISG